MAGQLYQVWVPESLVKSEGARVLTRRFTNPELGQDWVAKEKARLQGAKVRRKYRAEEFEVAGPNARTLSFRAAAAFWMTESVASASTKTWYQTLLDAHILPALGGAKVGQIGRARLQDFLDARRAAKVTADTCRRLLIVVRAVLRNARERGYRVDETAWKIKLGKPKPKTTRRYDPDVINRLIDAAEGQDKAMLQVAAWTGMRRGELAAFDATWILWGQGRIEIPYDETFEAKDREPRSVPLFPRLEGVLKQHLGARRAGRVFMPEGHGSKGIGWTKGGMISQFRRLRTRAGVKLRGWHDLRHHYLSDLAASGAKAQEIQEVSGHQDLASLQRYLHASPDHLQHLREALQSSSESSSGKILSIKKAGHRKTR